MDLVSWLLCWSHTRQQDGRLGNPNQIIILIIFVGFNFAAQFVVYIGSSPAAILSHEFLQALI